MTYFVRDDGTLDEQLAKLGLRRKKERAYPLNGQLYLGRGGFGSTERGIYRSTRKAIPKEGFSGADLFELLEPIDPSAPGFEMAEDQGA